MKRLLFLLMSLLPMLASARPVDINGLWYNLNNENKTAVVVASEDQPYTGALEIPPSVTYSNTTYIVVSIGESAFEECDGLTGISISSNIESIERGAFFGCRWLQMVQIPNGVKSIGYAAFSHCDRLSYVYIPNSVTSIGEYAFDWSTSLQRIDCDILQPFDISNKVFNIPEGVYSVYAQTKLVVPDGTKSAYQSKAGWNLFENIIEASDFGEGGKIGDIFKSDDVYYIIGANNTVSVTSVTSGEAKYSGHIDIPAQVEYNGKTYAVASVGASAFETSSDLLSVTIANGVTSIGRQAFNGCGKMTSITIPASVNQINFSAFNNCNSLTSVYISDLAAWCAINFKDILANPLRTARLFLAGSEVKDLVIPNTVTSISSFAFSGCNSLTTVTIPNSVIRIGDSAFSDCTQLKTVVCEAATPPQLGASVFDTSGTILKLIVPKGKKSAYQSADGWSNFNKIIELGEEDEDALKFDYNGVTYYVDEIQTPQLAQVKKINNSGDIVIPSYAIYGGRSYKVTRFRGTCGNSGMTSISIPNSIEWFTEDAFVGCTSLTAVKISDLSAWCRASFVLSGYGSDTDSYTASNPLHFAHNLYLNNNLVTTLNVPGVTDLPNGAFEGASCLTSISFQSNTKSIGMCCFQGCTGLKELTIPNTMNTIGQRAFSGCEGLQMVTIGSGMTKIGDLAFDGCTQLKTVTCEAATPPQLGASAFGTSSTIYMTLIVPKGKKSAYQSADGWSNFNKIVEVGEVGYQFINNDALYEVTSSTYPYTCKLVNGNFTSNDVMIVSSVYDSKSQRSYQVTAIGELAFSGVKSTMTSVHIPNTIKKIETGAFYASPLLERVYITDLAAYCNMEVGLGMTAIDNYPSYYSHNLYLNNVEITDLVIPNGVTRIHGFINCSNIKTVYIPASVTDISDYTFIGCTGLETITLATSTPPTVYHPSSYDSQAFSSDAYSKVKVMVPQGALDAYRYAGVWSKFTNISEPGGPDYEFTYNGFKYKVLENNPSTSIYTCELIGGNYSSSVTIPTSAYEPNTQRYLEVTSIGTSAFLGYKDVITSVTIPATIKTIKEDAFNGCIVLTRVNITDLSAFCKIIVQDAMTSFDNHPTYYAHHLYLNNVEITDLTIPSDVTEIKLGTFAGCTNFKSVTIPEGVTTIDASAFYGCNSLTSITIGSGVKSIGSGAFEKCTNATDVYCEAEKLRSNANNGEGLYTHPDAFKDSYLQYITLHVPYSSIEAYRSMVPWMNFKDFVALEGTEPPVVQKCATPVVTYSGDRLFFTSDTEGVEFISTVTASDAKNYYDSKINLSQTYMVSVYATKDDYEPSDVVTKEITILGGGGQDSFNQADVNKDGVVNVADHVELSKIIKAAGTNPDPGNDPEPVNPSDDDIETDKITASFTGGAYSSINGRIQSGSKLNVMFWNNSSKNVTLTKMQLNDATTGIEGNNLLTGDVLVAAGQSVSYTITVGALGIYKPVISFTYKYNNTTYQAIGEWVEYHIDF